MANTMSSSKLSQLLGTWYLSYSTLGVWKAKGVPRCELTNLVEKNGVLTWTDTVWTNKRGWFSSTPSPVALVATDTATNLDPLEFRWRGHGWLRFVTADCKVLAHDLKYEEYLVVHFGPTWFTEEGVDVMTRSPDGLPKERLDTVVAALEPPMQAIVHKCGLDWTGLPGQE